MPSRAFFIDVPRPSAAAAAARASYRDLSFSSDEEVDGLKAKRKLDKGKGRQTYEEEERVLPAQDDDDGPLYANGHSQEEQDLNFVLFGDDDDGDNEVRASASGSRSASASGSVSASRNNIEIDNKYLRPNGNGANGHRRSTRSVSASSSTRSDAPPARRVHLVRTSASGSSSRGSTPRAAQATNGHFEDGEYEYLDTLPQDLEIVKILARNLAEDGSYEYIVKLDDEGGQCVRVSADLIGQYEDLLDDYETAIESGRLDESGFLLSSDEDPEAGPSTGRKRRKRSASGADEDYGGGSPEPEQNDEMDVDEEEDEDEEAGSDDSDIEFMGSRKGKGKAKQSVEPTRRSGREGARKDYSAAYGGADADEEESGPSSPIPSDEDDQSGSGGGSGTRLALSRSRQRDGSDSNDESDDDDMDDGPIVTSTRTAPKPWKTGIIGSPSASDEMDELAASDEAEDQPDLSIEQVHTDACCNPRCRASPADRLLQQYKSTKRGRKRRVDDDEMDEDRIRELGAWLECGTCSYSYHFGCLPGGAVASSLKVVIKKLLVANHTAPASKKPHMDINRAFRLPSCQKCLPARGTNCMICSEGEPVEDISKLYAEKIKKITEIIDNEKTEARDKAKAAAEARGEEYRGSEVDLGVNTSLLRDPALKRSFNLVPKDVLFRCLTCGRPAHYKCIPPGKAQDWQYRNDWSCGDCTSFQKPIDALLAWRRLDSDGTLAEPTAAERAAAKAPPGSPSRKRAAESYKLPNPKDSTEEAEYLVKFKEESFRKVVWVSHAWLLAKWPQRLRNFVTKGPAIEIRTENRDHDDEDDDALENFSLAPNSRAIEDIPKEWITPDRILEVEYKRKGQSSSAYTNIASANMKNQLSDDPSDSLDRIARMFIKWQGLAYESATWETMPKKTDPQYNASLKAYETFLKFRSVQIARPTSQQLRMLDEPRPTGAYKALTEQPDFITNGTLMDFQLDGVSWLYFNWWKKKGCILADEMGLGKTVQIISYLSILFAKEHCQPFLVVVPNSTLSNWQREFEKWAPSSMRVVPYYGSQASKRIIEKYELFTAGSTTEQKLRAHVVLTTYESLTNGLTIFKRVPRWESLVVDEAQRLKAGGTSLLWKSLRDIRIGHTVLLTGTPVNNNLDELFNLLNFIDPSQFRNLNELHEKYENLTPELVNEIQDIVQPYFLRRTKEAVLNLPPLTEVIVPVSMSLLQKEVYKSVLKKNTDALKAIFDPVKAKSGKKTNAGKIKNALMELRKTLCHPYLVEDALEHEANVTDQEMHQRLVEGSSKLTLLQSMLPKLKARGHRVLLFSQFVIALNIIERFLQGERIKYVRLDGSTPQADRQDYIDRFNAPDSDISIFILSTRAGGVGINLATADTVIIHDADFNPFQDLQAISRAHRIGQKKKVLCFKLMVKDSCEEKIVEKGKKKMVLEQLIIDSGSNGKGGDDDDEGAVQNVESLLIFGAQALFQEQEGAAVKNEITYSSKAIDELIENTEKSEESEEAIAEKKQKSIEANKAFSYARVWERRQAAEDEEAEASAVEAQRGFWTKMLKEEQQRQDDAALAEKMNAGRGHRKRKQTNYAQSGSMLLDEPSSTAKGKGKEQDPDFAMDPIFTLDDEDDSDFEAPNSDVRQEQQDLVNAAKKQKFDGPNRNYIVYVPPVDPSAHNSLPAARYEIPRSVSPVDIRIKRADMLRNLQARALQAGSEEATRLVQQATNAKSGAAQVDLMLATVAALRMAPPPQPFTVVGSAV